MKTSRKLILVTTQYTGGALTPKHPIMVMLKSQIENLDKNLEKIVEEPNLQNEATEDVTTVVNANDPKVIEIDKDKAKAIKWPYHLSPTPISTLIEYPLDYVMHDMLNIVGRGLKSVKDTKTAKGKVAHAVIEHLFKPQEGSEKSTVNEIEARIKDEFDIQFEKQMDASGAILNMPENKLEGKLLKEQLWRCLGNLIGILKDNGLSVTGCERRLEVNMGLMCGEEEEDRKDMTGYIDMTLEDEKGSPVVIDFKWTSSKKYYNGLLEANRSTQLELYRAMLWSETGKEVERTAYFLMPEGRLYSKESFKGSNCTQMTSDNKDDIVEQIKNSFSYRKEQIENGQIESGEGMNITELAYGKDTETKGLFALPTDDKGNKAANKFSDYGLFK
jgi:hypothetical protein